MSDDELNSEARLKFKTGKRIGPYTVVSNPSKPIRSDGKAVPLGVGASWVVYQVTQTIGENIVMDRALKLFDPIKKLKDQIKALGSGYTTAGFLDELRNLSELTHQNLVKVIDGGIHSKHPYYV